MQSEAKADSAQWLAMPGRVRCVCVVWVNQERCVSRVEVILNGVWSVCLSAP